MMPKNKFFWRSEVFNFVESLDKGQVSALYWILKSYGCVRTGRALKEDIDSFFSFYFEEDL